MGSEERIHRGKGSTTLSCQQGATVVERHRLQPGELVATVGAARADREVVADQLAAAVGEDRWTAHPTCALLLVAAGREPPDETALWEHAAKDRGVTVAGGMRRAQRGANFDDENGRKGISV